MGPLERKLPVAIMMDKAIIVLCLVSSALCVPTPEASPQFWTGSLLAYHTPYVTYHAPVCETEYQEILGKSCVTKPVTECNDIEIPSHTIKTESVCVNVTTAHCNTPLPHAVFKREADPQLLVGTGLAYTAYPYHACLNAVSEQCYPQQTIVETTITEKSCLIKPVVECEDVVVAKFPKVTCVHEEHDEGVGVEE